MYPVSEAYREAMHSPVQRFRLYGRIGVITFDESNILSGSFSITNQCSGNDTVDIGQVYIGELNATFLKVPISRKSWKGKIITPIFSRRLADGSYEDVPLGQFTISTADWTSSGIVVKAYDNMAKLDDPCSVTLSNATAYELLNIICDKCGILLGNSADEIRSLPNGTKIISMYEDNDIDTWRDALAWLAQALGAFATMGRDGKLYLRTYGTEAVDVLDDAHRFKGGSFSDFATYYTGISVVNTADKTTSYYGNEEDDGLTMNLGSNPFLQFGVDEEVEKMRRNVLEAVSVIHYVPFKLNLIGDPAYDLGDILRFTNGLADSTEISCITKYVFRYNRNYEVQGVGKDPALANAKSKTDKNISGLINTVEEAGMHYAMFRNSREITIGDGESKPIMAVRFVTVKVAHVSIYLEVHLDAESTEVQTADGWEYGDILCKVTYYYNGVKMDDFVPIETWQDGKHILTLHYDLDSVAAQINNFDVWLTITGGSIHIDNLGIMEVIGGNGMAASGEWGGIIDGYETFEPMYFTGIYGEFTDSGEAGFIEEGGNQNLNEDILSIDFCSAFVGVSDEGMNTSNLMIFTPITNTEHITTDCEVSNYAWQGHGRTDLGTAGKVILPPIYGMTGVEILSSNALFYASFDGGTTWKGFTEEGWITDVPMLKEVMEAVPASEWRDGVIIKTVIEQDAYLQEIDLIGGRILC